MGLPAGAEIFNVPSRMILSGPVAAVEWEVGANMRKEEPKISPRYLLDTIRLFLTIVTEELSS